MNGARSVAWGDVPPREREVATLVERGLSDKAIAARLGVSVRTVETQCFLLARRLGPDPERRRRQIIAGWVRAHMASVAPPQQHAA